MKHTIIVHSMNMNNMKPFLEYYKKNNLSKKVKLRVIESSDSNKIISKLQKIFYMYFKKYDGIISDYPTKLLEKKNKVSIAMGHGTAMKKFPSDKELENKNALQLSQSVKQADYYITTSDRQNDLEFRNPVLEKHSNNKYLSLGLPKNDYYFDVKKVNEIYLQERKNNGFSSDSFIVVYAPTWRDYTTEKQYFNEKILTSLNKLLSDKDAFMIYRPHPLGGTIDEDLLESLNLDRILISKNYNLDTYSTLCIADALISDYSSICIEYLPLNRPIISLIFDEDEYNKHRGLEFNFRDENISPGVVVTEIDKITETLQKLFNNEFNNEKWIKRRKRCLSSHYTFPDGNASERIWRLILNELSQ